MISAILVDDEVLTVKALKKIIESRCININIVGEAHDGLEALELVEKLKPDFAIIDIRMPNMDGIELMEKITERSIKTKVIVLSAYRDFEYASKALQYGAWGYLVKPVDKGKLLDMISKVEAGVQYDTHISQLKDKVNESIPLIKEKYLKQLVNGTIAYSSIREEDKSLLGIEDKNCRLIIISPGSYLNNNDIAVKLVEIAESLIKEVTKGIVFLNRQNEFIGIYNCPADPHSAGLPVNIRNALNTLLSTDVTIALSSPGFSMNDICLAYREAKIALVYKFYMGLNSVIAYNDVSHIQFEINQTLFEDENHLIEQIRMGISDEAIRILDEMFENLQAKMNMSPEMVYNCCYKIILFLVKALKDTSLGSDIKEQLTGLELDDLKSCGTLKELAVFLKLTVENITELVDKSRKTEDMKVIVKAKLYCTQNYPKDITLDLISEHVNMARNYFCAFFKKKSGENFWDYLTDLRINRAKELLETTDLKIAAIAEKVGYKNASHFCRIFKEAVGVSPSEYKGKIC